MRRLFFRLVIILAAASLTFSVPAISAPETSGAARVIDGDTIAIGDHRIRLFGIDAPEEKQSCTLNAKPWNCGQEARRALASEIGDKIVSCTQEDVDRYKRIVAICRADNVDLNDFMVRKGWALAYRSFIKAYISAEAEAQRTKAGIWSSTFDKPWDRRRHSR